MCMAPIVELCNRGICLQSHGRSAFVMDERRLHAGAVKAQVIIAVVIQPVECLPMLFGEISGNPNYRRGIKSFTSIYLVTKER